MCGIFGAILFGDGEFDHQEVVQAQASLSHRGPDDSGTWLSKDRKVVLAHTRLSILDLDARSRQPFESRSKKSLLTYNGEIYNFREMVQSEPLPELRTTSDTEVLVELIERKGVDGLSQINGMFAFGFLSDHQLLLAVDPAGQKPLYTYWDGHLFAFSSEIKAFRALSKCHFDLDNEALAQFLVYGYVPLSKTLFRHIRKLPGGHFQIVHLTDGPRAIAKYWDLPRGERLKIEYSEATKELKRLMSVSVQRHLHSDVPLGSFLSGGVDSSVVSLEAARCMAPQPLHTFSASFALDGQAKLYDESLYAKIVSQKISSHHHVIQVDPHKENVRSLLKHFDEPFGDSSCVPTSQLCERTSQWVKVALSGDGGDELFGGYRRLRAAIWTECNKPLAHLISLSTHLFDFSQGSTPGYFIRFRNAIHHTLLERLNLWNIFFDEEDFFRTISRNRENLFLEAQHWEKLLADLEVGEQVLHFNFKTYLFSDLLPKIDRMSMLHGLEVRCPFLDKELIEFAFRLPTHFKLTTWKGKRILKDAYREELGSQIVDRPKKGFAFPIETFVNGQSQSTHFDHVRKHFPHAPESFSDIKGRNRYYKYFALLSLEDTLSEKYERSI